jgi:hypothetical protein
MQFTSQEMKLIERLRKQERRWPRVRWALLGTGVFVAACYSYILLGLYRSLHFDTLPSYEVLFFALMWPKCLLGMIGAAWLIVWPLTNWHGSVRRMLLLRLLDAQQTQKDHDDTPS